MKRFTSAMIVALLLAGGTQADVIKPNDVRATSEFGVGGNVENLVNGDQGAAMASPLPNYGLVPAGGPGILDDEHALSVGGGDQLGWIHGCLDAGVPGGSPEEMGVDCEVFANPGFLSTEPVDDQIIEFEFDGAYDLTEIHIWNNNDDGFAPDRGLDEFEIEVSSTRTGATFTPVGTTYNLTADTGFGNNLAQDIALVASGVRRVRLLLNSRHGISADPYVGLSEVRFSGTLVTADFDADASKDGTVGGLDFLRWQQGFGLGELETTLNSTLTATQSEGDFDNNNVNNAGDLAIWEGEYGDVSPLQAAVSGGTVPEPSALVLAATVGLGSLLLRRRRH